MYNNVGGLQMGRAIASEQDDPCGRPIGINLRKAHADRPFAAAQGDKGTCPAEGSEASRGPRSQTLRCGSGWHCEAA